MRSPLRYEERVDIVYSRLERKIFTSAFVIRTAHRGAIASELYNRASDTPPNTILELGGGFGKSLADLIRIFPAATALYVDLPVNMAVAAHYLTDVFRAASILSGATRIRCAWA